MVSVLFNENTWKTKTSRNYLDGLSNTKTWKPWSAKNWLLELVESGRMLVSTTFRVSVRPCARLPSSHACCKDTKCRVTQQWPRPKNGSRQTMRLLHVLIVQRADQHRASKPLANSHFKRSKCQNVLPSYGLCTTACCPAQSSLRKLGIECVARSHIERGPFWKDNVLDRIRRALNSLLGECCGLELPRWNNLHWNSDIFKHPGLKLLLVVLLTLELSLVSHSRQLWLC